MNKNSEISPAEAKKELALRELARRHLYDFNKYVYDGYKESWHLELLCDALEKVLTGDIRFLIVEMPPRHGKSMTVSQLFPAYAVGKEKDDSIIVASYSGDLATDHGRETRNLIDSKPYQNIFDTKLAPDSTAKGKWNTNGRGAYNAVGIGGSITGKGAKFFICVTGDTCLQTPTGIKQIKDAVIGDKVLSLGEGMQYNRITAIKKTKAIEIYEITSGKNILHATGEHRIFVLGKGYIEAKDLQIGDKTLTIEQPVYKMREGQGRERTVLPELLPSIEKSTGSHYLRLVWNGISQKSIRDKKGKKAWAERFVLLNRVFSKTSRNKKQKEVFCLWNPYIKKDNEVLLPRLQKEINEKTRLDFLSILRANISAIISFKEVLLNGMQKQLSLATNGATQSELQTRYGYEQVSERVSKEKIYREERPPKDMCRLFRERGLGSSSQGLQPEEQHGQQSGFSVSEMSYDSSQLKIDTISSIVAIKHEVDVYDITVENANNFFANGILTHNCDDPFKDRMEADSEVVRESRWKWLKAVARTRLTPDGRMVIFHTRWHQDDIIGRLTERKDTKEDWVDYFDYLKGARAKWVRLTLPAIATKDELHRKQDEALWSTQYPLEELEDIKKTLGPYEWGALYQQNPTNDETREFKTEWYKRISEEALQYVNCRRFLTIDTAMSKAATADYTGFCDNRVNKENFWHIRAWHKKLGPEELVDTLFTLYQSHKYEKIGIEKTAYTDGLKPYLDNEQRKRGVFLPIVELGHKQISKEIRIRGLIPLYASGTIFHIDGWCADLEEEQAGFPVGIHDDILDSLAYQLQMDAQAPKKTFQGTTIKRGSGIRGV